MSNRISIKNNLENIEAIPTDYLTIHFTIYTIEIVIESFFVVIVWVEKELGASP